MDNNKLGFGLMRLPLEDVNDQSKIERREFARMVDTFLASGFSYFDTGYFYHMGNSEIIFREEVVGRYSRETFTIADKMPISLINSKEQVSEIFEEQLERCGVEYFDYYFLHALGRFVYEKSVQLNIFEFVEQKKAEGKIRKTGFSFHDTPDMLERMLTQHPEMDFVQLQLNYLDWDDPTISARRCYDIATKHRKPVIVMEPIKGGCLADIPDEAKELFDKHDSNASMASWAIRFAASHPNVSMVLSGMSNEAQMLDNLSYMSNFQPLNTDEMSTVSKVAKIMRENIVIPCTNCRYCVNQCPKNIDIPDFFAIYNNLMRSGANQRLVALTYYGNLVETYGKASECLGCKECERVCPQYIGIAKCLKDVANALEK